MCIKCVVRGKIADDIINKRKTDNALLEINKSVFRSTAMKEFCHCKKKKLNFSRQIIVAFNSFAVGITNSCFKCACHSQSQKQRKENFYNHEQFVISELDSSGTT
jgi:hypothetical protein